MLQRFLFPRLQPIEAEGKKGGQRPAEGPCHPNARGTEAEPLCENEGKDYPQQQVCECGSHKIEHGTAAPQNPVAHNFDGHYKIEGCHDMEEGDTCLNGGLAFCLHEQTHGCFAAEEIEQEERNTDQNAQQSPGAETFPHTLSFSCTQVLGCTRKKAHLTGSSCR